MQRICRVLVFTCLLASVYVIPSSTAAACPAVAYLAVGPTGDPASTHVPGIPHGAYRINIRYPAQVERGDHSRAVASTALTHTALTHTARTLRARCPNVHLSIRAASLGASAASLATDGWIGTNLGWNTDAIYYGNPRNPGNGRFAGIEAAGLPHIPGVYTWRGRHRTAWWIRNVCHTRPQPDGICWTPRPWNSNLQAAWNGILGYTGSAHRY